MENPIKPNDFELSMGNMHYADKGEGDPIVIVYGNQGWEESTKHWENP